MSCPLDPKHLHSTPLDILQKFYVLRCSAQNCTQFCSRWGSIAQSRARQSFPLPSWQCWVQYAPGYSWPFWLLGHTANSDSTCHQPELPDLLLQGCPSTFCPSLYVYPGLPSLRYRIWHLLAIEEQVQTQWGDNTGPGLRRRLTGKSYRKVHLTAVRQVQRHNF